jgi:hypothetical protein
MVPHLRQSFNELADLISAALSHELPQLIADSVASRDRRSKLYPNLNTSLLADLLDKVSE